MSDARHSRFIHAQWPWLGLAALLLAPRLHAVDIASTPLFLATPLEPNVILTLDDSGSMGQASQIPFIYNDYYYKVFRYSEPYHKSSHYNPYYYDPKVTYPPALGVDGNPLTTSFTHAYVNGFVQDRGWINLESNYRPTINYNPESIVINNDLCTVVGYLMDHYVGTSSDDFPNLDKEACAGVAAYYYEFVPTQSGCDGSATDVDCYKKVDVSMGTEDEKQNFANWFSFYRTRNLMTVTAASRAFYQLRGKVRLAWQSLNVCREFASDTCTGWDFARKVDNQLRAFSGSHLTTFYDWLFHLRTASSTPLRTAMERAGEYFGQARAYRVDPDAADSAVHACRDNIHVLMTDGEWSNDTLSFVPGNADSTAATLPDGRRFAPPLAPYSDANTDSLADIAFKYWKTDLYGTAADNYVLPNRPDKADLSFWNPKNDEATWQHMVNFVVGLGLTSALGSDWQGSTYEGAYASFKDGTKAWYLVEENGDPNNYTAAENRARVYDLWHAALNSRGEFFSAERPEDLQAAFQKILDRVEGGLGAAAALAASSTRLDNGQYLYQATFDSTDWSGELIAWPIVNGKLGDTPAWQASEGIPLPAARKIYTWDGAAGAAFPTAGQQTALGGAAVANYLRGDRSGEQRAGGAFRNRSMHSVLGDIVNSTPVYVATQDYGYARLPEGSDTGDNPYKTFLAGKKDRAKMLYLGANDGMLHAIKAADGTEAFAYVPNAVVPNLALLSAPAYTHRYYVDGSPYVGDAFLDGAWKTILLGTTGAGGRAVFALDVTDPSTFATANPVKWEKTNNDAGYADLGYTLGKPVIARLNTGQWAAVFGNGYNSASGHAVLYVADLDTGSVIKSFDVGGTDNGLGTPSLYDANGDGVTDYVYAGDMEGRLWKFRLTDEVRSTDDPDYEPDPSDTTRWGVGHEAYEGQPLFTARNASEEVQPITAPVEIGNPPPGQPGVMLYFGTGRYLGTSDKTDLKVQSFYGILDNGSTAIAETDRSTLQEQTIIDGQGTIGTYTVRTTSNNPVTYPTQRGWYMDLIVGNNAQGERVIAAPALRNGFVFFTTMFPSADVCSGGREGWTMAVDTLTGGADEAVFDFDDDGSWDTLGSYNVSGGLTGFVDNSKFMEDTNGDSDKLLSQDETGTTGGITTKGSDALTGRVSWREIID